MKHAQTDEHRSGVINKIVKHDMQQNLFLVATVCGVCFMQVTEEKQKLVALKTLYFTKHNVTAVSQIGPDLFVLGFGHSRTERQDPNS